MTNIKILLVEDEPIAQKVATITLEQLGYKIDVTATGNQALTLYNKLKYHLILLDLGLPDIDGTIVAAKIRKIDNIPIIALTAHTKDSCEKMCQEAGINHILSKPLTKQTSLDMINKFCPNSILLST